MNQPLPTDLSRIDKLLLDRDGVSPEQSRAARASCVPAIAAGADVASSEMLQVALLTAVNLAHKSFSALVPVLAPQQVWDAKPKTPLAANLTLREELLAIGATPVDAIEGSAPVLVLGDAHAQGRALRVTFDGWRVGVGPAATMARMPERHLCALAAVAAAAVAVGEAFSLWAGIDIEATRKNVAFSLWRPDLPVEHPHSLGDVPLELPRSLELFGLGHLGQAYVWSLACLPIAARDKFLLYLCDDDVVELPNLETGALLRSADLPGRKTRVVSRWLQARAIDTRLIERFIDHDYRRCGTEPVVALAGFDNNNARQWLAGAGFTFVVDAGLGGEASNFDSVAVKTWPQSIPAAQLWPLETDADREKREDRQARRARFNAAYADIAPDDCGKLLVANKAVAIPFVGAIASALAVAELLRRCNAGPAFDSTRARACALGSKPLGAHLEVERAPAWRGLEMVALNRPSGFSGD